ncbi:MAG: cell division protein FtsZ, partial [Niameybacter sp.]
ARCVLINMAGGESLGLMEANMGANLICECVDPDAEIIFGTSINEELGDEIIITVIATDFHNKEIIPQRFEQPKQVEETPVQRLRAEEAAPVRKEEYNKASEVQVEIPHFLRRSR